jgi:DNA-binding MarR family transcriptional regulator
MSENTKARSRLIIDITNLVIGKYPVKWKVQEIALATGSNQRTVERALHDMVESGLLEKRHHSYTLSMKHINQIYGAQWYVRQAIDKDLLLKSIKEGDTRHDKKEC